MGSQWVGLKHFRTFFSSHYCGRLISNTLLLQTAGNTAASDIIGAYVYTMGVGKGQFSYTAAIGLMVNVINFALVLSTNAISGKMHGETLF